MDRIEIYLEKSAGAAGEMGAAANRFKEHLFGMGKIETPRAYAGHNTVGPMGHVMASNPRFLAAQETFNPKTRAQALGGNLADASDRIINAPRKMLTNANFGRNIFRGL